MKSLKSILTAIAFVFAFGVAFAFNVPQDPRGNHSQLGCIPGTLVESGCAVQPGIQCTVQVLDEIQPAFEGNNCGSQFFALRRN